MEVFVYWWAFECLSVYKELSVKLHENVLSCSTVITSFINDKVSCSNCNRKLTYIPGPFAFRHFCISPSILMMRDNASHTYKTTGKMVLCTFIFKIVEGGQNVTVFKLNNEKFPEFILPILS